MKLRNILNFDLGRLLGRRPPERKAEYWWTRLRHFARGVPPVPAERYDDPDYRPGKARFAFFGLWTGPFYLRRTSWRNDLLMVTQQIAAIARTNAPLVPGLEATAREEARQARLRTPNGLMRLAAGLAAAGAMLFVGGMLGIKLLDDMTVAACLYFACLFLVTALVVGHIIGRGHRVESVFLALRGRIAAGRPLSETMETLPRFFPRFHVDLVRAGEASGRLAECLDDLGEETLSVITTRRSILMNIIYIGGVFCFQALLIAFICVKIVPVFAEILEEFGSELPGPAQFLIQTTDFLYYHWTEFLIGAALAVIGIVLVNRLLGGWSRQRRWGAGKHGITVFFLFIPGLRGLLVQQNLATLTTILEKMLGAGAPMDQALAAVASTDLNPVYAAQVERVRKRILEGEALSAACRDMGRFSPIPRSFTALVALGERSGMLPEALARLGVCYRQQAAKRLRIMVDGVLPIGVVILGLITLLVQLAIYSTLTSIIGAIGTY